MVESNYFPPMSFYYCLLLLSIRVINCMFSLENVEDPDASCPSLATRVERIKLLEKFTICNMWVTIVDPRWWGI